MRLKRTDLTILVVDDDKDARSLLTRILESRGFRVITSAGVAECMELLEKDPPHLAILDVELLDGTAFDILSQISLIEKFKKITFMLLSNHSETKIITKAISMGIKDYLVKPINSRVINERVEKILESYLETRGESILFPNNCDVYKVKVSFKGNLVRLGENGFDIVSNLFLRNRTHIDIKSGIFDSIGVSAVPQKVMRTSVIGERLQKNFKGIKYESHIAFVAVSEQINKKIRKFINVRLTGSHK